MKLSYQWLKELIGIKLSPERLAEVLNLQVAGVEKLEKLGKGLDKVVVAKILEIKKHPQADRLQLAKVTTGKASYDIVCGAFNIKVGDKVPLALPGAKLPNGMEIKESVIRGVKSEGMLCAEDELGVGEDHTGILILDKSAKIGQPVAKVLGLDDVIIEIENSALTHRPDLFGHLGFAREIAALTKSNFKFQILKPKKKTQNLTNLKIKVENYKDCPRYMAVVIDGVKIEPSPLWLQNRLRNLGLRPINNIVDITNYILLEIGQPLHAFDYHKLESRTIIVRRAENNEKLLCLDGIERKLDPEVLVIADEKKPIALAGIMGGEESGISEKTRTVVIESANFNPVVIRKGARNVGLRTEASLRFEKGLPLVLAEEGIYRAIELIKKITGGKVVSKIYDLRSRETEKRLKTKKIINLEMNKISDLIGEKISKKQITQFLNRLGFVIKKMDKSIQLVVPLYRSDVEYPEDVIEEISRLYGYQKIKLQPIGGKFTIVSEDPLLKLEKKLRNILIGLGFDEVYNYSFYGESLINLLKLNPVDHLEITNPLNPEQRYLRISLLPKILENAIKNIPNFENFRIFECGRTYKGHEEKHCAGLVLEKNKRMFYLIKGIVEMILEKIGFERDQICFQQDRDSHYQYLNHLTRILVDQKLVGFFGQLNETIKNNLKITAEIGLFEINLESLKDLKISTKIFKQISPYPPITRDLAFLVPKNIIFNDIFQTIKNFHPLIYLVEPFDVFESEKLGQGVRNIAFHLTFQSFEKTLKSDEVNKIILDLVKILEQKFGAKLRNF
ncbi:MAG: phenylalanine--tRNA ligase subunit beta [Patescibacteria group bacterium]|nr:phenylalanine--tRNA ligase subunit beta [Patescibacteria group bacterium]